MWPKKKQKLDPRVRFETPDFKRRLRAARNYKRVPRYPAGAQVFRAYPRLTWGRLRLLLPLITITALFLYLTYIPNPFFIRRIVVTGAEGVQAQSVLESVTTYVQNRGPLLVSNKNLLFLRKADLESYLLATNREVYRVRALDKDFFHTLHVDIEPRVNRFALMLPKTAYAVSADGLVTQRLALDALPSHLVRLRDDRRPDSFIGEQRLTGELRSTLVLLSDQFNKKTGLPPDYFEVVPVKVESVEQSADGKAVITQKTLSDALPQEVVVQVAPVAGKHPAFKVIFDVKLNVGETLNKLSLLLSQLPPEQVAKLHYIDMRFKHRGFICLIGTPCAQSATF